MFLCVCNSSFSKMHSLHFLVWTKSRLITRKGARLVKVHPLCLGHTKKNKIPVIDAHRTREFHLYFSLSMCHWRLPNFVTFCRSFSFFSLKIDGINVYYGMLVWSQSSKYNMEICRIFIYLFLVFIIKQNRINKSQKKRNRSHALITSLSLSLKLFHLLPIGCLFSIFIQISLSVSQPDLIVLILVSGLDRNLWEQTSIWPTYQQKYIIEGSLSFG